MIHDVALFAVSLALCTIGLVYLFDGIHWQTVRCQCGRASMRGVVLLDDAERHSMQRHLTNSCPTCARNSRMAKTAQPAPET